jgi:hypothetical protein
MRILTKSLLVTFYPLLLLARLINLILGRDRLQLRIPMDQKSLWVERTKEPNIQSYFSEASRCEGGDEASAARPLSRLLRGVARLYTPPRGAAGGVYQASADRQQGIPDEVYTLW